MESYCCAEVVEKEIEGFVRLKRFDEEKHEFTACLISRNLAERTVYIVKSY